MEKKKALIIAGIVLVICAVAITIGVLSEKKGNTDNVEEKQIETVVDNKDEEKPVENEVLTVENCEDFANLLSTSSPDVFKSFAENYKDKEIEFDGYIADITNHEDYDTRYDILIRTDNPILSIVKGPNFKFEDVSMNSLGIESLDRPDFLSNGSDIKVKAKVYKYNEVQDIFFLKPILVEAR